MRVQDTMSAFARSIYLHKYALRDNAGNLLETEWGQTAIRVATHVLGAIGYAPDSDAVRETAEVIAQREFLPGGRYLYSSGKEFHQTNNCFHGSTRFITRQGVRTLEECAGQTVEVLNRHGEWEAGEIRCFGVQPLKRVEFSDGGEVLATADHLWWQEDDTRVKTTELTRVPLARHAVLPEMDEEGIRHGIIFGDGHSMNGRYTQIVFVNPEKAELVRYFKAETRKITVSFGGQIDVNTIREVQRGIIVSLQPAHYKQLPTGDVTPEYARGFIAGLIATDGSVPESGSVQVSCEGLEKARRIAELAVLGGCVVNSVRVVSRVSPFTGEARELASVAIKPFSAPLLREAHAARVSARNMRKNFRMNRDVECVEDSGVSDLVYCAVVPGSQSFTLANGVVTSNCLLLRAEDSREGWADLLAKCALALQTGAGIGVEYSDVRARGSRIRRTGGVASGPVELMRMVNEIGRGIRQGGDRRSAIWAGLVWSHPDVPEFLAAKDWPEHIKAQKAKDFNAYAPLDMTNVSVGLDDDFFAAMADPTHPQHEQARKVYAATVAAMFRHGEPGFAINLGSKRRESLRNAPVAAETRVLTDAGWQRVGDIVGASVVVWTGHQWARTEFKRTAEMVPTVRVSMSGGRELVVDPTHPFILDTGERIPAGDLCAGQSLKIALPPVSPVGEVSKRHYTLGFVHGDGSFYKRHAEATVCAPEKMPCLDQIDPELVSSTRTTSQGYTRVYFRSDDFWAGRSKVAVGADVLASSPGDLRSFIAGLFDADGSYDAKQHRLRLGSKHRSLLVDVQRILEQLGILSSINVGTASGYTGEPQWMLVVNTEYLNTFVDTIPTVRVRGAHHTAYRKAKIKVLGIEDDAVQDVYCCDVGVDEHSFMAEGVIISNCCEVTSEDDSDVCNLGSINLARIESVERLRDVVRIATRFLLAGTVYSDMPYEKVAVVRAKNRRLGLGVMGLHEWLLARGKRYQPDAALGEWLSVYRDDSRTWADHWADLHSLSRPVAVRAIAPTGTIGILAETTTGIEPIFCCAYKRRYLGPNNVWQYQYVVDPTAKRLVDAGVDPDAIEDATTLALDMERRLAFQGWVQEYVDMAISSTINLPPWESAGNSADTLPLYAEILLRYLPRLRGITVYPDGARGGQPLTPVSYREAAGREGVVYEETEERCVGGVCGV